MDIDTTKRKRGASPTRRVIHPRLVKGVAAQGASGNPMDTGVGVFPVTNPSGVDPRAVAPTMNGASSSTVKRPRRKAVRKPPRRLPVSIRKHDIWGKLAKVDAGLSVTDWLSMDKQAIKDLVDGCRTLKSRRKKVSVGRDNIVITTADPTPRIPKLQVATSVAPTGSAPQVMAPQMVAPPGMANQQVVGAVNLQEEDSEWQDDDSETSGTSDSWSTDGYDTDEEMEVNSDAYSVVKYPYNIQSLRCSAPLKGPISINGVVVECTFDSGAAVSVMSESLAKKLGLQVNGDQMHLTSFDSVPREPCNIVPNVPIRIGGHLRSEHMCIQRNSQRQEDDYCILGMTWFRTYGATIRAKDNVVSFPISTTFDTVDNSEPDWPGGVIEIQCYSSHDQGSAGISSVVAEPSSSTTASQVLAVSVAMVAQENANPSPPLRQNLTSIVEEVLDDSGLHSSETVGDPLDFSGVPDFLQDMVMEYERCFVEVSGLGRVDLVSHEIPTLANTVPIKSRPFRLTWEEQDQMAKELGEMLDIGLIRPSKGVWSSPCFFIRKKDGSLRLVIDYRRLNRITIKDNYPLPIIDTVLDTLAGARIFSTLDAASGYHQVPMDPDSIEKTGFVTPQGTYEFQVMPFGLTSAPATYQRMMTNLLGDYLGRFVMVFIDDVIVFSRNQDEHREHLRCIFERCQQANLRLKFKKCSFGSPSVEYLGHTISAQGVSPHAHNINKILAFPAPKSPDEVRSFLGTCGYYRRFIESYAAVATPLTDLLKKNKAFYWGYEQDMAYQQLKEKLVGAPILAYPDRAQVQILTTDASKKGISAILSQSRDGSPEEERVISYNSRTLRPAEENYSTVHLEALAVVWAVTKYRHYLVGRHFKLRTDNAALTYVMAPAKPSPKLARWAACLIDYDFEIVHLPGKSNPADALSRLFPVDEV